MTRWYRSFSYLVVGFSLLATGFADAAEWTRFRGPNGQGVSTDTNAPTSWSATSNVKWKRELPGPGTSSPIIVGKHIFVTSFSGYGTDRSNPGDIKKLKRHLVCINREDGKIVWSKEVPSEGREDFASRMLMEHGYASQTPASDGTYVFAFFGKSGVVAFDMAGKKLWQTAVGTSSGRMRWGSGASPILYKNLVIINASDENEAIVGLNKKDGKQVWKAKAEGFASCWGTPVIVKTKKRDELVLAVPGEIWGLNPEKGKLLWYAPGVDSDSMCSSLLVKGDVVYAVGGQRPGGAIAVRCGGKGDVSKTHVVWKSTSSGRINTPVLVNDRIYWVSSGIAQCLSVKDGKQVYRARLGGGNAGGGNAGGGRRGGFGRGGQNYCSPIAVNGNIFMLTRNGTTHVYKAGTKFESVSTNSLDDNSGFNSTPAVADGQIYIRSNKYLYCIAAGK